LSLLLAEEMNGPTRAKTVVSLLDRGFADAELVGAERVPASKVLLAALSPAMEVRLARASTIECPGVSGRVLRAIRDYTCGTPLKLEQLSSREKEEVAIFARAFRVDSFLALTGQTDQAAPASPGGHRGPDPALSATKSKSPASPAGEAPAKPPTRGWPFRTTAAVSAKADAIEVLEASAESESTAWEIRIALVAAALSLLSYLPAMKTNHYKIGEQNGGFFMDDAPGVARNPSVIDDTLDWYVLRSTDYWGLPMFDPTQWTHKSFRPFTTLSFRLNFKLHGLDSCGWWFTNVIYHGIASALFAVLGRVVLRLPTHWSIWAGALFAVHPVHTENMMYLVGRADILCSIVLCAAMLTFDWSGRRDISADWYSWTSRTTKLSWAAFGLSMLLVVVSGLCKETGFTMFGMLVIAEGIEWRRRGLAHGLRHCGSRIGAVLVIGTVACMWRVWYTDGTGILRMDPMSNPVAACENGYTRKLSYAFIHGVYWKLMVWPFFLCYDYSMDAIPLIESVTDERNALSLAAYLAFACCLHGVARSLQTKALVSKAELLALALFALSFLPMSSILFVVGTVVGERLLYSPSAALVFVLASMATSVSAKSRAWRVGFVPGFAVLWAVWGVRCYYRTIDWADSEAITIADGLRQLKSSRTQFNLGNYYLKRNELDLALAAYDRSIKADPLERDASPLWHAGQIHILRGNWQAAEDTLRKAVNGYFSPLVLPEEEVFHDLGLACYRTKKEEEAIYYIQAAVTTNPMLSKGWNNLACTMVGAGLSHSNQQVVLEGLQAIDRAIQINPSNVLYWRNAAILLYMVGDQQASVNAFNQVMALEQNPAAQMSPECVWEFYLR
jgi:tetratricopeptide (TPR) repeat protein